MCCSSTTSYMILCHTLHPTHSCFASPLSLTGSKSWSHAFANPWKDLAVRNNIKLGSGWLGDGVSPHQSNGREEPTASYGWTGGVWEITGASSRPDWEKCPIIWGGNLENILRFYEEESKVCQTIFYINKINKHLISDNHFGTKNSGDKRNNFGTERVIICCLTLGLILAICRLIKWSHLCKNKRQDIYTWSHTMYHSHHIFGRFIHLVTGNQWYDPAIPPFSTISNLAPKMLEVTILECQP